MSPWRLLIVSEPGKDGVFMYVRSLIRHLHLRHPEITVDLAFSSRRCSEELPLLVEEVKSRGGEAVDLHVSNAPEPADFPAFLKIREMVRRNRCSLVHALSSKAGGLVRLAALLPSFPPAIYTAHAYFGMARKGGWEETLYNGIETVLGRIGMTHCGSDDERAFAIEALKVPEKRISLILTGIDTDLYSPPSNEQEKIAARRSLGLPESGKLLVTIGRDSSQKNYEPLYAALNRMLPAADWTFGHAGAGAMELRQSLSFQAAQKCFTWLYIKEPVSLLRAADGFIMTSRYEGLSLSMLYALSCGLPLIMPDAPGFRILKRLAFDEVRWLPNPGTTDLVPAIGKAVAGWAAGPACKLPEQRALARRHFTESVQLEELVALYRACLRPGEFR